MTRKQLLAALAALAGSTLAGANARADAEQVATARQLAITGIDAVEGGHCDKGAPLLERAEKLHHAAVHLQYLARCRSAEGKLVAATELWRRIVREGAPEDASPAVHAAVTEATSELAKALPRLGQATIRTDTDYKEIAISLDGETVPTELIGTAQVVDPGDHDLAATAPGFAAWSKHFSVEEGGTADVVITLTSVQGGAASGSETGVTEGAPASWMTPAGWIVASTGAVALIAGTVTLFSRNSRRDDLEKKCPDQTCPVDTPGAYTQNSLDDEKNSIRTLTTATNVLMVGGGALLAGGVTLIVLGKTRSSGASTAVLAGAPRADAGLTFSAKW